MGDIFFNTGNTQASLGFMYLYVKKGIKFMGKRRVEMNFLNWDAECYHDLASGNGFLITDPPTLEFEGGKTRDCKS